MNLGWWIWLAVLASKYLDVLHLHPVRSQWLDESVNDVNISSLQLNVGLAREMQNYQRRYLFIGKLKHWRHWRQLLAQVIEVFFWRVSSDHDVIKSFVFSIRLKIKYHIFGGLYNTDLAFVLLTLLPRVRFTAFLKIFLTMLLRFIDSTHCLVLSVQWRA